MTTAIEIDAKVTHYIPNAMSDEYESGGFAVYDATVLQVISPVERTGPELMIYHNQPPREGSMWRTIGCRMSFKIEEALLGEGYLVFAAAAKEIRRL